METASQYVENRFVAAGQVLDALAAATALAAPAAGRRRPPTPPFSSNDVSALRAELEGIQMRYGLLTCSHFVEAAAGGWTARAGAQDALRHVLATEDFAGDVDRLIDRVAMRAAPPERARGEARAAEAAITTALRHYSDFRVAPDAAITQIDYTRCPDCQQEMTADPEASELRCSRCPRTAELIGIVFDDAQFYSQEGQKAKSGTFNPNRHCNYWLDHLLARESEEEIGDAEDPDNTCGEKLIASLRRIADRDHLTLRHLTVRDCRRMLSELKQTELNKNVPLIMRKLTGIGPPALPETICQRAVQLFATAVEIQERIRKSDRTNRSYYPFYLYKIFAAIIPPSDYENRRILYYIFLQSPDTLKKNDLEWHEICREMDGEIVAIPTSYDAAERLYRPR